MRRLMSAVTGLAWMVVAHSAHAGLPEDLRDVTFHPDDPDCFAVIYAQVGGGLLLTCDGGDTFQLLCASAILGEINVDATRPYLAYTPDDHLVVGHFDGLFRGDLRGCGFERVSGELGRAVIRDVVNDPSDPGRIYALSSSGTGDNGIHLSTDGGQSWEPVGELEPVYFSGLRFAPLPDDGQRMVVSVGKPNEDYTATSYFVRVSDDGGDSFTELAFPEAESMRLLGVDQADPDRFYALATFAGEEREALMTNPAAGTEGAWERLGDVEEMGSFVTPPAGGFWAADVLQRVVLRSEDGTAMEPLDSARDVSCYAQRPDGSEAFTCRSIRLYRADAQGEPEGDPLVSMWELESFVQCDDPIASQCRAQMQAGWCDHHFVDAPVCGPDESDGGADSGTRSDGGGGGGGSEADAGGDAAAEGGQASADGGGCTALPAGPRGVAGAGALWWLGACLALRRRRDFVPRG